MDYKKLSSKELLDVYSDNLVSGSDSCSYYSLTVQGKMMKRAEEARAEIMRRLEQANAKTQTTNNA